MSSVKKFLKAAQEIEAQAHQKRPEPSSSSHSGGGGGGHDESNWLVSYADMMTLLCGFFILLFSMAKLDEPQYEKVKEAVSQQFGGQYQSPSQELARFVSQVLQEAGLEKEASIQADALGVSLIFQSTLFFETLSAEIRPEAREALLKLTQALFERQKQDQKEYQIVVEGHTDPRPVVSGVYPSNWELSGARASRVIRFFLDQKFSPDHLTAIGYADTRPEVPSRTPSGSYDEAALTKNRRVVIRILDPKVDSIPLPKAAPPASPETASAVSPAAQQPAPQAQAPAQAPVAPAPATSAH